MKGTVACALLLALGVFVASARGSSVDAFEHERMMKETDAIWNEHNQLTHAVAAKTKQAQMADAEASVFDPSEALQEEVLLALRADQVDARSAPGGAVASAVSEAVDDDAPNPSTVMSNAAASLIQASGGSSAMAAAQKVVSSGPAKVDVATATAAAAATRGHSDRLGDTEAAMLGLDSLAFMQVPVMPAIKPVKETVSAADVGSDDGADGVAAGIAKEKVSATPAGVEEDDIDDDDSDSAPARSTLEMMDESAAVAQASTMRDSDDDFDSAAMSTSALIDASASDDDGDSAPAAKASDKKLSKAELAEKKKEEAKQMKVAAYMAQVVGGMYHNPSGQLIPSTPDHEIAPRDTESDDDSVNASAGAGFGGGGFDDGYGAMASLIEEGSANKVRDDGSYVLNIPKPHSGHHSQSGQQSKVEHDDDI